MLLKFLTMEMKRLIILFFGLVICLTGLAQVTFQKTFGGEGIDVPQAIKVCSNGEYVVGGYSNSIGTGGHDIFLSKINLKGEVIWTKSYGGSDDEFCHDVLQTRDLGYLIGGRTKSFGNGTTNMYLIKTDSLGDTLWTKVLQTSNYDAINKMILTLNGDILLAGRVSLGQYVERLDSSGNTLWSKVIEDGFGVDALYELSNGDILLGANRSDPNGGAYITKLDSSGTIVWSKTIQNNGTVGGFKEFVNGNIGAIVLYADGKNDVGYIKLNSSGSILLYKKIGTNNDDFVQGVTGVENGILVVGQTKGAGQPQLASYITLLDSSGSVDWTRIFNQGRISSLYDVVQNIDGSIAAIGAVPDNDNDCYLIKMDTNIGTRCNDSTIVFFDSTLMFTDALQNPTISDSTLSTFTGGGVADYTFNLDTVFCYNYLGCTDPLSDNYNPDANIDDGSCFISGCTDSSATNFNPDATVDDSTCILSTNEFLEAKDIKLFPNPAQNSVQLDLGDSKINVKEIEILDTSGKKVYSIDKERIKNSKQAIIIDLTSIEKGNYVVLISTNKGSVLKKKLLK